ncbi:metallophosphoesterase [Xenorhabdus bovienii]|uniref:metallophosphoesterase n=1 Tax=Xenorhabdus bovienii TaxID=40576 RepID=UPI0023B246E9|nr:metallophosphoesterase [Xenorhabdus bovienii]MDE9484023.1 metallophosphoesterase [Xenorhabdus bovienii]
MNTKIILGILISGALSVSMFAKGDNITVNEMTRKKTDLTNYRVVIMADPQPWRLSRPYDLDPNSKKSRGPWLEVNKKVSNTIRNHSGVYFYIVNGDLTEFGREVTYKDYANVYKKNKVPVYEGMGNHDYANNVGDCTIPGKINTSKDACAISAIKRMANNMDKKYSKELVNFSKHLHKNFFTGIPGNSQERFEGSLSYSWDFGDIHYVQLQNYPTYQVPRLKDSATIVDIEKSLNWLEKDLGEADKRGKATIINFHDGNDHFIYESSESDLNKFKSIITKYNVKAIFLGHTHHQSYSRAKDDKVYGNIPVYTAGALFDGDYYLLEVTGKVINVKAFNALNNTEKNLGNIGEDADK